MAIERRGNQWYYRFQFRGDEYREPTGLEATKENMALAKEREKQRKPELQVGKIMIQTHVHPWAKSKSEAMKKYDRMLRPELKAVK